MNLAEVPPGTRVVLTSARAGARLTPTSDVRLRELGLRPGADVTVALRTPFGGRVVLVGRRRIALDAATVRRFETAP
ncbi:MULTISPECIES: FeoA family protein [Oerskovia]|jgi:ferrous iron transport protein A|uniref:Ferrous iron transport protein A n=1 Tax=Oerskovia merdavium TaxID=2762227 RepID=A0ABR8U1A7_9CELL|nr:FeoA family protein [Oerskovia merdavium]MBD7981314.1 ferrous iron transport protein A [Oerskovia merdavium]